MHSWQVRGLNIYVLAQLTKIRFPNVPHGNVISECSLNVQFGYVNV